MSENLPEAPQGEFVLFRSEDGKTRVECRFESDTLWLSQASICELYGKAKATISEHISNVFTQKRRQLKEAEGARANIAALKDLLKASKQKK